MLGDHGSLTSTKSGDRLSGAVSTGRSCTQELNRVSRLEFDTPTAQVRRRSFTDRFPRPRGPRRGFQQRGDTRALHLHPQLSIGDPCNRERRGSRRVWEIKGNDAPEKVGSPSSVARRVDFR